MSMKFLHEMLELIGEDIAQTQVADHKYGGKFNFQADRKRKPDELGRGMFSTVMRDRNDPHMVQKKTTTPMGRQHDTKADGFDAYVRMLVENGLMDNIHFPKVYKAKKTTDNTGTHRNSYTIEKLEEISALSQEEFDALVEHHLLRPVYDARGLADRVSGACNSKYDRDTYIRMDSLKEACETIEELDDVMHFRLDIHEGNLMVRRTPYGVQLVISDPFGMVKAGDKHLYQ